MAEDKYQTWFSWQLRPGNDSDTTLIPSRELDEERRAFEARLATVKDVLPLAEQIMRFNIGIGELLAFHSAVYEKVDMERIPPDTAAYKVVEEIRDYSQLGGLKKQQNRLQQQIFMFNAFMANRQAALMSLIRLQSMGISEDQILNMDQSVQQYNGQYSTLTQANFH